MEGIEIIGGRIYVEGTETTDPALIGYAILDLVEANNESGCKTKILSENGKQGSFVNA